MKNISDEAYRNIARHILLIKLLFAHMASIKDAPCMKPVVRQIMKQQFNKLWDDARSVAATYNKVCEQQKVDAETQTSEALMWEAFELLFDSPDPVASVALLKAFNQGEVKISVE